MVSIPNTMDESKPGNITGKFQPWELKRDPVGFHKYKVGQVPRSGNTLTSDFSKQKDNRQRSRSGQCGEGTLRLGRPWVVLRAPARDGTAAVRGPWKGNRGRQIREGDRIHSTTELQAGGRFLLWDTRPRLQARTVVAEVA